MQNNLHSQSSNLLHVAIIMDGNGRWAERRGLPRRAGHAAGVEAVHRVVEAAPDLGVRTLTLYAFSSDNWRRPAGEVRDLMDLLARSLRTETVRFADNGVRLNVIGRRDRLPIGLGAMIARAEAVSAAGTTLDLRVALDYSARDAILTAAKRARTPDDLTREGFARLIAGGRAAPDVDLLIRTSGEQRLSDFLLWECAYAEFFFTSCLWPDFDADDLAEAVEAFRTRERRFGGRSEPQPGPLLARPALA